MSNEFLPLPTYLSVPEGQDAAVRTGSLERIRRFLACRGRREAANRSLEGTKIAFVRNGSREAESGTYLVEKLVEQFDADEHGGSVGKFISHDIQECLGTENVVLRTTFTPLGPKGGETKFQYSQSFVVHMSMSS